MHDGTRPSHGMETTANGRAYRAPARACVEPGHRLTLDRAVFHPEQSPDMGVISVNLSVGGAAPAMAVSSSPSPPSPGAPWQERGFDGRSAVGRPVVMFFYLADENPECVREIQSFRDLYPRFQELGVVVVGVGVDPAASHQRLASQHKVPFPLLSDPNAHLSLAYGAAHANVDGAEANVSLGRRTVLIDANRRIARIYDGIEVATHAAGVLRDVRRVCFPEEPRRMIQHAPVLLVPNVLPADICRHLIDVWESRGSDDDDDDDGFMRPVNSAPDAMRNRDHGARRDGALRNRIRSYVADRVIPEVQKAFNYEVTRFEDFRIACHDAARGVAGEGRDGGGARPRRDNETDGAAHRRFSMALLLNDDYDGGMLRFPEYGPHLYRPPAGCAVVFSCSLLHEATDVTSGRRFVLLSFFYGEQEARLREEYHRRTAGAHRSTFTSPVAPPSTAGDKAHAVAP